MPRYLHYFNMPVTGAFSSDHEDFEAALKQRLNGRKSTQAIKSLVDDCDVYYSIQNIEPTDMPNNPTPLR